MNDLLIKNALVIDGTGVKPYTSDILIDNDKITKIWPLRRALSTFTATAI